MGRGSKCHTCTCAASHTCRHSLGGRRQYEWTTSRRTSCVRRQRWRPGAPKECPHSVANSESYRRRGCTAMRNVFIVASGEVATRDVHAGIPTRHVCSASHRSRPTTVPSSSATQGILFATEPTTKGVASKHLEQLRPPPTPNPKRFLNVAQIAALKRMRAAESEGSEGVSGWNHLQRGL